VIRDGGEGKGKRKKTLARCLDLGMKRVYTETGGSGGGLKREGGERSNNRKAKKVTGVGCQRQTTNCKKK